MSKLGDKDQRMATSFNDPFAAYDAATNWEAHTIGLALHSAGLRNESRPRERLIR